jgi:hypothetical protein
MLVIDNLLLYVDYLLISKLFNYMIADNFLKVVINLFISQLILVELA